jgi:hypothetical protein
VTTEIDDIIEATKAAFYAAKGENAGLYDASHGFRLPNGYLVCCFWNQKNHRLVRVYLNDKGLLLPYFEQEC